jgi:hypothetical protein
MALQRGMSVIDRVGHRYNRLLVLSRAPNIETPNGPVTQWHCRCDCGTELFVRGPGLAKGARGKGGTQSCGCLNRENDHSRKHGLAHTRGYHIWQTMLQRCENPKAGKWEAYGGRGITVCEAWHAFPAFHADMGDPDPGMTLDRIDNDKGYGPDNCRWATRQTQGNNRRTNVLLPYGGRKMSIADWAREVGLTKAALTIRIAAGWSVQRALTEPLAKRGPRKLRKAPPP